MLVTQVSSNRVIGYTTPAMYMTNLTLANLLTVLVLPFIVLNNWHHVSGTASACKFASLMYYTSCTAGFITLGTVAVDRYRVIHQRNKSNNKVLKHTYIVIGMTWIVSLICSAPAPAFTEVLKHDGVDVTEKDRETCVIFFTQEQAKNLLVTFKILICVVWGAIPVLMMTWFYTVFYRALHKVAYKKRSRTLLLICVLLAAFLVLQTPFVGIMSFDAYALYFWELTCANINHREAIVTLARIVPNFHCLINPILYAFLGNEFVGKLRQCVNGDFLSKKAFMRAQQSAASSRPADIDAQRPTSVGGPRPV